MKLAIGTAQFGLNYGIANNAGKINQDEAIEILNEAKLNGINTIDTAIAYGDSEKNIGNIGVSDYNIVTKIPEIPDNISNLERWIVTQIENSLNNLKIKKLYGVLLHRPYQLFDKDKKDLWNILIKLKKNNLVKKIGYSIYSPSELDKLWNTHKPDLIQSPYSIFDRRLEISGWLHKIYNNQVELHARSIFLQGLILMNKKNRPKKFNRWKSVWNEWDSWLEDSNINPLNAALSFVISEKRISKVIVGVDNKEQLKEIISISSKHCKYPKNFYITDSKLLDPSKWDSI